MNEKVTKIRKEGWWGWAGIFRDRDPKGDDEVSWFIDSGSPRLRHVVIYVTRRYTTGVIPFCLPFRYLISQGF